MKILLVDDEVNSTRLMSKILLKKGYNVVEENDSIAAKEKIEKENFDIVISDLQMPGLSGLDLLKQKNDDTIFIVVTGYGSVDSAVEAMKHGAYDYINKPFNLEEFSIKVDKAAEKLMLTNQINRLRSEVEGVYSFSNIIGCCKSMQKVFDLIQKVSDTNVNVLIQGQSGTGKELVARAMHFKSSRKEYPFVAVNCSAIPENLLESELFGHTKGAYTGAIESQKGVFEQANGGTLLLDEVAEMPYNLQAKLLRVIETLEVKAIGSDKVRKINVRIISATNQNLKELIDEKKFREDLYYRLSTFIIQIPPLNERREDIPILVDHILKKLSKQYSRQLSVNSDSLEILMNYDWSGNVRELENVLERAVITSSGDIIYPGEIKFLSSQMRKKSSVPPDTEFSSLKDIEKAFIKKTLQQYNWNKLRVSKILGIDRKTLYKKIQDYNLG